MSRKTIRVLIVDDHAIVREGYRALLAKQEGITVVGEACDAASAYQCYKDKQPDVVIMDISMPGRGGIDAITHIREFDAHARVLVFTMHSGAAYALQAFRAGAKGYVTKSSSPDVLVDAVKAVSDGRLAICPEIAQVLAFGQVHQERSQLEDLSPREFEILRMILEARTTDEIASAFHVSRNSGQLSLQHQIKTWRVLRHRASILRLAAWCHYTHCTIATRSRKIASPQLG
jgi:two-component system, NarL family, invasion response regulator UvrY